MRAQTPAADVIWAIPQWALERPAATPALVCEITEDEAEARGSDDGVAGGRRALMVDGSSINPVRRPVARLYVAGVPEPSAGPLYTFPACPGSRCLIARSWPS